MRAFSSSMNIDTDAAARAGQDFWRKWQETVSDATETWLEAAKAKGPAKVWSTQIEFGMRNAQRWSAWAAPVTEAPAKPAEPTEQTLQAAEPVVEVAEAPVEVAEAAVAMAEPVVQAGEEVSADSGPDDLKRIRGIGPAIEQKLNGRGITTYGQIAAMSAGDIEKLDAALDFRGRIARDGWVGQAEQLALRSKGL